MYEDLKYYSFHCTERLEMVVTINLLYTPYITALCYLLFQVI